MRKSVFKKVKTPRRVYGLWTAKAFVGATTVRLGGIDGNKKVKGIERHVVVDRNGFLIAVTVTIACVHDGKAAYLLTGCQKELCCNLKVILADAGYRGEVADRIKKSFGYMLEVIVSGDKSNGFKPIGKKGVVERTFS